MARIFDIMKKHHEALLTCMSVIIGFITLVFVIIMFIKIQLPSEFRGREVATSEASLYRPGIEIHFYVASNPLLDSEYDREYLSQSGLKIRVVRTPYRSVLIRSSPASEEIGFLFLLIANRGPGIASSIDDLHLDWDPKGIVSRPSGLLEDTTLGQLLPGESYAILMDASDGLSNQNFNASNAKEICINLSFTDIQSNRYLYEGRRCMTELEEQPPLLVP